MKVHLVLNGRVIAATLADNDTAREFIAMLPMTITMHDMFRREKFGPLPKAISAKGTSTQSYEVGDMICWSPGPDLTIFHGHDGQAISGAIQVLGRIDAGIEAFREPGPIEVRIELAGEKSEGDDRGPPRAIQVCGRDRSSLHWCSTRRLEPARMSLGRRP
ncbi:Cyclophilin-like [Variovorax sp. HW608]|uniref:cyclophilin-like fold protein n=1 Tax=Variovorax sp. HW608 TaxID=1034889 RepID=UPI0008201329|nr:cyclophilin-like fold protein [Variovorax sp. HW608]SCK33118.1 Cyclophilin-like [Variovorax sp. HW608]